MRALFCVFCMIIWPAWRLWAFFSLPVRNVERKRVFSATIDPSTAAMSLSLRLAVSECRKHP